MKKSSRNKTSTLDAGRIYEVAKQADVSIVTVSRVFNNYAHVSDRMRARVFAAARAVGYKPRVVTKRRVIAVIVGHMDQLTAGDYKTRLILQIVQAAAHNGFLVEFIPYDSVEMATEHHVDGVIEVGLTSDEVHRLEELPNVPTVLINKARQDKRHYAVCSDHVDESRTATEYLIDHGHTAIALVLDEDTGWGPTQRIKGYTEALARRSNVRKQCILSAQDLPVEIARQILDSGCTAVILFSDNLGLAVLDALHNDFGKKIPGDISIVGLENKSVSPFMNPRLTTIEQPLAELAESAVACIVNKIKGVESAAPRQFKSRLIERDSVKRN